jgi:hypothetical protein
MSAPLVIRLQEDPVIDCHLCGRTTRMSQGIPINAETGEVVPNSFGGDWIGASVCVECFERHEAWSRRHDAKLASV